MGESRPSKAVNLTAAGGCRAQSAEYNSPISINARARDPSNVYDTSGETDAAEPLSGLRSTAIKHLSPRTVIIPCPRGNGCAPSSSSPLLFPRVVLWPAGGALADAGTAPLGIYTCLEVAAAVAPAAAGRPLAGRSSGSRYGWPELGTHMVEHSSQISHGSRIIRFGEFDL
jgi:hypothetical protein